jgi:malate/lactate dehydrogenase
VLGENGVNFVIQQTLAPEEQKKLHDSAETIDKVQQGIVW